MRLTELFEDALDDEDQWGLGKSVHYWVDVPGKDRAEAEKIGIRILVPKIREMLGEKVSDIIGWRTYTSEGGSEGNAFNNFHPSWLVSLIVVFNATETEANTIAKRWRKIDKSTDWYVEDAIEQDHIKMRPPPLPNYSLAEGVESWKLGNLHEAATVLPDLRVDFEYHNVRHTGIAKGRTYRNEDTHGQGRVQVAWDFTPDVKPDVKAPPSQNAGLDDADVWDTHIHKVADWLCSTYWGDYPEGHPLAVRHKTDFPWTFGDGNTCFSIEEIAPIKEEIEPLDDSDQFGWHSDDRTICAEFILQGRPGSDVPRLWEQNRPAMAKEALLAMIGKVKAKLPRFVSRITGWNVEIYRRNGRNEAWVSGLFRAKSHDLKMVMAHWHSPSNALYMFVNSPAMERDEYKPASAWGVNG